MFKKNAKIYIAGHTGLLGSALVHQLQSEGYCNIITRSRQILDLTNQNLVFDFFQKEKPEYVFWPSKAQTEISGDISNHIDLCVSNHIDLRKR